MQLGPNRVPPLKERSRERRKEEEEEEHVAELPLWDCSSARATAEFPLNSTLFTV